MTAIVLTLLFTAIGLFAVGSTVRSLTGGFAAARAIWNELYGTSALPATRRMQAAPVTRLPAARRASRPLAPRPAACA